MYQPYPVDSPEIGIAATLPTGSQPGLVDMQSEQYDWAALPTRGPARGLTWGRPTS